VSLGPGLGQCCGGAVTLRFELAEGMEPGGRALLDLGRGACGPGAGTDAVGPLPEVALSWIDTAPGRFPEDMPETVTRLVAADPRA
jgi:xanthine dehydrogenase accessory factor